VIHFANLYSPNDKALSLETIPTEDTNFLIVGDFNSHSQSWGYDHIDGRGDEVGTWQDEHNLILINDPDDQPTFYSRRWHTTSTPDLGF
jgi:endonuclease/exonuclease/phosphatase family metal-dependent hydrolase